MRVLMVGWEYPPEISGGLGTACHGLTRALAAAGVDVIFVLPRAVDETPQGRITLIGSPSESQVPVDSTDALAAAQQSESGANPSHFRQACSDQPDTYQPGRIDVVPIAARLAPYDRPDDWIRTAESVVRPGWEPPNPTERDEARDLESRLRNLLSTPHRRYEGDLFGEVQRYAERAVAAVASVPFDVVHAHDWMSFPAGARIAQATGRPWIAHVHSTEFDRSAYHIDQRVYDIEREGLEQADAVIAVSHLTKSVLKRRYGIAQEKVTVIYNAVDVSDDDRSKFDGANGHAELPAVLSDVSPDEKIVLFLGRITVQKGPEYFLAVARRVLEVQPNVRFVMAGAGDMAPRCLQLAAQTGIADKVLFTGFLQRQDVERVFRCADLYVMPSVAEPFGLATLEAISHDVPVLVSRNAGVSQILHHVLKADFWDVDDMANKIVAVLRHPPLHATLTQRARLELRQLSWSRSAGECVDLYRNVLTNQEQSGVDRSGRRLTSRRQRHGSTPESKPRKVPGKSPVAVRRRTR